jgi:2-methylcitrate dehydratase PrpD
MASDEGANSLDRRIFVGAGTASILGLPSLALAQQQQPPRTGATTPAAATAGDGKTAGEMIADFIVGFDLKTVPPAVIERARVAIVDTVGVMLAGSQLPPADIACDIVKLAGSAPVATIVGRPLRAAPQLAALANGVAGHCMDFDLTYFAGQSIAAVIPAILPIVETQHATPAEMLAAFIIAAEIAGRVSRAAPTAAHVGGWHSTGTVGVIAAAAACARLKRIESTKIPDVIGITASLASGVSVNFGSMTKPLHSGHAAHDGVLAAMLGERGFTANAKALEGKDGYFECFARGLPWSLAPFDSLGKSYDLIDYGYKLKPYPSGGLGHPAIDAALELRDTVKLDDVAHVDVAITKYARRRYSDQYPQSAESAKFSGPYLAAYTLVHGAPMLAAFTEEALHDPAVRATAQKISLSIYQDYADLTDESPAKVTVTLNDGRKIERAKYYPSGSVQVPMSAAQIRAKFDVCAAQAIDKVAAERIYATLLTLGDQPSLDDFWPLLRKA